MGIRESLKTLQGYLYFRQAKTSTQLPIEIQNTFHVADLLLYQDSKTLKTLSKITTLTTRFCQRTTICCSSTTSCLKQPAEMDNPKPQIACAAERNKQPILDELKKILPDEPLQILEIASGTGQHICHFAQGLPKVQWQPSDIDASHIRSISAFIRTLGISAQVRPPIFGNVLKPIPEWPAEVADKKEAFDVVICSNMIHISPWACTLGLFSNASYLLKPETGILITYGPYAVNGVLSPDSNISFDRYLKSENPEWGVRDIRDLIPLGASHNLHFQKSIDMPANNKILIFKKGKRNLSINSS